MENFDLFNLPEFLLEGLKKQHIKVPTPIQAQSLPVTLAGQDILASAQTGTGKTLAYLLPLLARLENDKDHSAIIVAPTRELALQIIQSIAALLQKNTFFKSVLLIGGAPMGKQLSDLRKKPQLIVGTPGRINDHLERGSLNLDLTRFLVIDEADRMLDMGFGIQLDNIAKYLPTERQTLMFSATLPPNIEKLSKKYLNNPQRIASSAPMKAASKVKQELVFTSTAEKKSLLLKHLEERQGTVIVFVKTRKKSEVLSKELKDLGHETHAMHGDLPQRKREKVLQNFRNQKTRILVATDVAARGLDIPHVMHVINYDLPDAPEDYVHRIGRTGRADAEGFALSLIANEDRGKWRAITQIMGLEESKKMPPMPKATRSEFKSKPRFDSKPEFGGRSRFGDKPEFGGRSKFGDKPEFGGRSKFGDKPEFGNRPKFGFGGKSKFGAKPGFGGKPKFAFGGKSDFAPRGEFGSKPEYREKSDFSTFAEGSPRPSFNKPYEKKGFSKGGPKKPSSWKFAKKSFR